LIGTHRWTDGQCLSQSSDNQLESSKVQNKQPKVVSSFNLKYKLLFRCLPIFGKNQEDRFSFCGSLEDGRQ